MALFDFLPWVKARKLREAEEERLRQEKDREAFEATMLRIQARNDKLLSEKRRQSTSDQRRVRVADAPRRSDDDDSFDMSSHRIPSSPRSASAYLSMSLLNSDTLTHVPTHSSHSHASHHSSGSSYSDHSHSSHHSSSCDSSSSYDSGSSYSSSDSGSCSSSYD